METLLSEVKRAGQMAGLFCSDGVNNSTLSNLKRLLIGAQGFSGNERFLAVGSETHKRVLEKHLKPVRLPAEEERIVKGIELAASKDKILQRHLDGAMTELLIRKRINGVLCKGTLDIVKVELGKRHGGDLKTTTCKSDVDFYTKAIEYDYPRQGTFYTKLAGLSTFKFYGLQKGYPFNVYHMDLRDFRQQVKEAEAEIEWLLYVYNKYVHEVYC